MANSCNNQKLKLIKEENNYYYKSLDDKEDLQKIENIKNDAEVLLQKLNNFFEKKKIYDILVKLYIELTSSKVNFIYKEEINNFIEKIYEILFFMENLKVPESKYSDNNENHLMQLLFLINNLKATYIQNKGEGEIEKILESIGEATHDDELNLSFVKTNFVNIYDKYFIKFIIKLYYDFFINKLVPIISTKIWNLIIKKEFYKE